MGWHFLGQLGYCISLAVHCILSPGALAAWLRLKHPDTVVGSVATSAPVLAKVDFSEYLEVVNASLATSEKGEERGGARGVGPGSDTVRGITVQVQTS